MKVENFKQLLVWQKSIELVKEIYCITATLPEEEKFGLISQMRRSSISVPSNIAEGSRRKTSKDFLQFLYISDGSCSELETQLIIGRELFPSLFVVEKSMSLLHEVQRLLGSLIKSISFHV